MTGRNDREGHWMLERTVPKPPRIPRREHNSPALQLVLLLVGLSLGGAIAMWVIRTVLRVFA